MTRHRFDPTRTTVLRRRFEGDLARRFRRLKGRVNDVLVEDDTFGFRVQQERFEFVRPEQKVASFMDWLRSEQDRGILEIQPGASVERAARSSWMNIYIDTAYIRGLRQALGHIERQGAEVSERWIEQAFFRPIHADRVGLIYTRAYSQLKGITEAMDQQISRELAQGVAEGRHPRVIARRINNRIDHIGITRARLLARTEVISSHAEASLNAYEEAGIEGVEVEAEFSTAGDSRVCSECAALEGHTFTMSEARGIIPVHPNCRCAWLPVVEDARGVTLQ